MNLGDGVHLSYCSNIHPGETWAEVRAAVLRHFSAVRDRVLPGGEFGIGLRLAARAAAELAEPGALADFRDRLRDLGLYVFTVNGFPYGAFHGTRVKEEVYLPDWRSPERLRYTNQLADLLARLLPDDPRIEGSISTVPGGFKPALRGSNDAAAIVEHLLRQVAHLVALRARSGRLVTLALEPEPLCLLETIDETVDFFVHRLHGAAAIDRTAELTGLDRGAAARALHDHLGVCLDLCHVAVEYEDAGGCIDRLERSGIRVLKLQISAGLRLSTLDGAALEALRRFDDSVYLHQVVEQGPNGLRRFADLDAAMASLSAPAADREWRVHFHVPVFLDRLTPFASTQPFIREVLARHRVRPVSRHLEVETYTWDVLPKPYRRGSVDAAVAREIEWVRTELAARDSGGIDGTVQGRE